MEDVVTMAEEKERTANYKPVFVTEVTDDLHFYVQDVETGKGRLEVGWAGLLPHTWLGRTETRKEACQEGRRRAAGWDPPPTPHVYVGARPVEAGGGGTWASPCPFINGPGGQGEPQLGWCQGSEWGDTGQMKAQRPQEADMDTVASGGPGQCGGEVTVPNSCPDSLFLPPGRDTAGEADGEHAGRDCCLPPCGGGLHATPWGFLHRQIC